MCSHLADTFLGNIRNFISTVKYKSMVANLEGLQLLLPVISFLSWGSKLIVNGRKMYSVDTSKEPL